MTRIMSKCQDCKFNVPLCTLWRVGVKCLTTPEFLQSLNQPIELQTDEAWRQEKLNEKAFVEKLIQQKENELQELNDRLIFIVQELEGEDPYL